MRAETSQFCFSQHGTVASEVQHAQFAAMNELFTMK